MTPTPQDDLRPAPASGPPDPGPTVPLLSLRGERRVIAPEHCRLGPRCLVCAWRRAGLLDPHDADRPPVPEAACPPRNAPLHVRRASPAPARTSAGDSPNKAAGPPDPRSGLRLESPQPHPTAMRTSTRSLPDPPEFCPGCRRASCRCARIDAAEGARLEASYAAGYEDSLADSYDERPMTEWVYATAHRALHRGGRAVHVMTAVRFAELTWRRHHATEAGYARWFASTYGHDLAAYLAGYDDAGAGLPSAVDDPDGHAVCASALDRYEPAPDLAEAASGPWPVLDGDDGLPF